MDYSLTDLYGTNYLRNTQEKVTWSLDMHAAENILSAKSPIPTFCEWSVDSCRHFHTVCGFIVEINITAPVKNKSKPVESSTLNFYQDSVHTFRQSRAVSKSLAFENVS